MLQKQKWFLTTLGNKSEPSHTENIIRTALNGLNLEFHIEVSFKGLVSKSGNYLRFDFYIPALNLAIEYDGKDYHSDKDVKARDKAKNRYCKANSINLLRLNAKHYDCLEITIIKHILKLRNTAPKPKPVKPPKQPKHKPQQIILPRQPPRGITLPKNMSEQMFREKQEYLKASNSRIA
jgi:very-short-patch-repair endonuclease